MHERDLSEVTPLGDNGCIGDRKVRMHEKQHINSYKLNVYLHRVNV